MILMRPKKGKAVYRLHVQKGRSSKKAKKETTPPGSRTLCNGMRIRYVNRYTRGVFRVSVSVGLRKPNSDLYGARSVGWGRSVFAWAIKVRRDCLLLALESHFSCRVLLPACLPAPVSRSRLGTELSQSKSHVPVLGSVENTRERWLFPTRRTDIPTSSVLFVD